MTTRKIDHKQIKTRGANTFDVLRVAGPDDLAFVDPNSIVVSALTGGTGITIEANGLIIGTAQTEANTDTVTEGTSNLYFTNARVLTAIEEAPTLIAGNIIPAQNGVYDLGNATHRWGVIYVSAGTISLGNLYLKESANGQLIITTNPANTESDSGLVDLSTDDISEGANLYFTNSRAIDAVVDNINTSNVAEGANLYFTNARVLGYVAENITTSNIAEGSNLYFTNLRVLQAVLDNIETSNVIEGANLYFTNARAVGSLTAGSGITIEANGLIQSSGEAATFTGTTDGVAEGTSNLYYTNARVEAFISDSITTSNITEGANLYFTNARVEAFISDSITTSNITEGDNLYFTNARSVAALTGGDNITIESNGLIIGQPGYTDADSYANLLSWFSGIDTDDLPEGTANLYFTNTRSIGALTGGVGIAIDANGLITATGNSTPVFDSVETGDLLVTGNLTVQGNLTYLNVEALEVDDNMIYLNANSTTANPDLGWAGNYNDGTYAHAGFFRDATDGVFKVFDGYQPEPEGAYIDTANATFHLANIQATTFFGNLQGFVQGEVSSLANHDTDDLVEGTSNLYFTNTRAIGSLTAGAGIVINANGLVQSTGEAGTFTGTTDGVAEGTSNLYYTNARVEAFISDSITTSNIVEGSNLYFTNARSIAALTGGVGITIESNGLIIGTGGYGDEDAYANSQTWFANVTTSNVIEGSNLYFSNVRAIEAVNLAVTKLDVTNNGTTSYRFDQYDAVDNPDIYITAGQTIAFDLGISGHPFAIQDSINSNVTAGLIHVADDGTITTEADATGKDSGVLYWKVPIANAGQTLFYKCLLHGSMVGNIVIADPSSVGVVNAVKDNITTSNVAEGANLYFTNTRAVGALTGGTGITIESNGLIVGSSTLGDTDDLPEGTANLYFTNTRAVGALTGGTGITIESNGLIIGSSTLTDTDDLPEGSANLYFTNARVVGAFTAGNSIVLESNGYIDIDAAYLTYASSQLFEGNAVQNVFTMNNAVTNEDLIIVTVDGSVLVPTTQYTVNGNQLTLVTTPGNGANVEVRYLNTQTSTVLEYYNRAYQGNGVQTVFQVSSGLASNSLLVFENGVAQVPYVDYTIVGANIVFGTPPSANTVVHIRELPKLNVTERLTANTDSVTEASNLYFTNARVYAALAAGQNITIEANGLIVGEAGIDADNGTLGNLVLTGNLTTPEAYITELTVTGNLTISGNLTTINATTLEIEDPIVKLAANNETSDSIDFGWVGHYSPDAGTTKQHAGVFRDADDGHFYIFSEYVDEELDSGNLVSNIDRANNTFKLATVHANIFVGNVTGTVSSLVNHDTDDLVEGTANLYFTNTRAIGALTGGNNVTIEANGLISADNIQPAVTISNSDSFTGNGIVQQYTLTQNATSNDAIIINVDGLVARPTVDYGVSGNTILTFTSAPADGSNIEVRYLGTVYATAASNQSIVRRAMVTAILFG